MHVFFAARSANPVLFIFCAANFWYGFAAYTASACQSMEIYGSYNCFLCLWLSYEAAATQHKRSSRPNTAPFVVLQANCDVSHWEHEEKFTIGPAMAVCTTVGEEASIENSQQCFIAESKRSPSAHIHQSAT